MAGKGSVVFFNPTDTTVIEFRDSSGAVVAGQISDRSLGDTLFEHCLPVRDIPSWKGKNVYEGVYWSSTIRKHVRFESFLEREWLIQADFDQSIRAFQWQPFALKWPRDTKGHRGHVPDYFARLDSGDGRVVDVKRADRLGDPKVQAQFAMTEEVCSHYGWEYEVFSGVPQGLKLNLEFLGGFRQDRYSPTAEASVAIYAVFDSGTSLELGLKRLGRLIDVDEQHIRGQIWHEAWHGRLAFPLESPMSNATVLTSVPSSQRTER